MPHLTIILLCCKGASSIGASVDLPFFSAFAAAAGKKSCHYPDSEESDPEVPILLSLY